MDRAKVKFIREKLNTILNNAGFSGVVAKVGNATFTDDNVTFKLTFSDVGDDGTVKTQAYTDFVRYGFEHGLTEDDLGRSFNLGGYRYTLKGYKPRSRKYPMLAEREDGKMYKLPTDSVKMALSFEG